MPAPTREPEWVAKFLDALARCGVVTRAAVLAGVDVTGCYNRRNRYPEFREAWDRVKAEREVRAAGEVGGEGEKALTLPLCGSLPLPQGGEVLDGEGKVGPAGDGVKVSRVAVSRWSDRTEARFLEELSATANVARAAAAVGFSAASAYKRRLRHPEFGEAWDAAIAVGRAQLESHLLVQANRAFDPDELSIAEGTPKVTVGEAISILKHKPTGSGGGARSRARALGYMDWVTDEDVDIMERAAAARASIGDKIKKLLAQDNERRLAAGYTLHGEDWIPPGWVFVGKAERAET